MTVFTSADAILGSLTVRNVRNTDITSNGQVINGLLSSGKLGQLFGGQKDLRATLTTEDVNAVASVSGIANSGLIVDPGTITIPFTKRLEFSTFASSNHYAASGTIGCVYPRSFAAQSTGNATCEIETIFASSDGLTDPVTESATHALGGQQFNDLYALGPISINGTDIDCPQSLTVNTGINAEPFFCQGHNFAKTIYIRPPVVPMMTIQAPSLEQILTALGGWTAGTSLVAYFRKRTTAGFVADANLEHIKFSFADGILDAGVSGSSGEDAGKTYMFTGEALTVSAGVAIT